MRCRIFDIERIDKTAANTVLAKAGQTEVIERLYFYRLLCYI